jgi:hypothetical protein
MQDGQSQKRPCSRPIRASIERLFAAWFHNARLIGKVASQGKFDLIVGNETYEIPVTYFFGLRVLPAIPFVIRIGPKSLDVAISLR